MTPIELGIDFGQWINIKKQWKGFW